jgi:hypothetical protein
MKAGWFALKLERIKQIEGDDFEALVTDLLTDEWLARGGINERAIGGRGKYVADGGRDWGLREGVLPTQRSDAFRRAMFVRPSITAQMIRFIRGNYREFCRNQ